MYVFTPGEQGVVGDQPRTARVPGSWSHLPGFVNRSCPRDTLSVLRSLGWSVFPSSQVEGGGQSAGRVSFSEWVKSEVMS